MGSALADPPKKQRGRPGPKPDPSRTRSALLTIRCRPDWLEWVGRYAETKGLDMSDLVDEALLRLAREDGFEMPPKR
jgi:hypothetical protein